MEHSAAKAAPMGEYDVAIVGAGPIGLMTANLLGLAGLRVAVFERNRGLLGLPRAIAYDAETLRLFAQIGLFADITHGLVKDRLGFEDSHDRQAASQEDARAQEQRVEACASLEMIAEASSPKVEEKQKMAVRSLSDIAAIEAVPLIERGLPESTYAALVASAKRTPNATALTFFRSADRLDDTHVWTYAELVADVTRAANLFASLGVATDRPAAFVLPNLPETHFTIWGGEAAGAALAINPMLEPRQIADLLRSARASVLVTLAPALNPKAWPVLAAELATLPDAHGDRVRRHG